MSKPSRLAGLDSSPTCVCPNTATSRPGRTLPPCPPAGLDPIGQDLNASSMARSDRHRGSIPRTLPLAGSDLGTDSRGRIPPQLSRSSRPGLAPSRLIHSAGEAASMPSISHICHPASTLPCNLLIYSDYRGRGRAYALSCIIGTLSPRRCSGEPPAPAADSRGRVPS